MHRTEELQAEVLALRAATVAATQQREELEDKLMQLTVQLDEATSSQEESLVCIK